MFKPLLYQSTYPPNNQTDQTHYLQTGQDSVVFGATGNQGGSVIKNFLGSPELSKLYQLRAVTRDPSSKSSKILAERASMLCKEM
jgi:hypothetical protein